MKNSKGQFEQYSKFYDDLYKDKNYKKETDFVLKILKNYGSKGNKLLSLGCGTCTYEMLIAKKGYTITGVDRSREMLKLAEYKIKSAKLDPKIKIIQHDIRNLTLNKKFDNIMAMFNIVGYQTKNEDFEKMLKSTAKLIKKGGVFIFDCWYMPAVLKDKPTDRIKKIVTKDGGLIRMTKSLLKLNENLIEINFDVLKIDKNNNTTEVVETHPMRYWSLPELQLFLEKAGFALVKVCNFMDINSEISDAKWDIMVVAKKLS